MSKSRVHSLSEAPFGYEYRAELVKCEEEQYALDVIRSMRQEGMSLREIAKILTGEGLVNRNGKPYTAASVQNVVRKYMV